MLKNERIDKITAIGTPARGPGVIAHVELAGD